MKLLKQTFALAVLAVAPVSVSVAGNATTATDMVNKSDLGISLFDAGTSTEGKGDCSCAANLYDNTTKVSGFHSGYDEELPAVITAPTTASATEEMSGATAAKANRKGMKSVAVKDGGVFLHMKAGRLTACVFGAPNASGCRN